MCFCRLANFDRSVQRDSSLLVSNENVSLSNFGLFPGSGTGDSVLRYEDTERGKEVIRKSTAKRNKDQKLLDALQEADANYLSGSVGRPPPLT